MGYEAIKMVLALAAFLGIEFIANGRNVEDIAVDQSFYTRDKTDNYVYTVRRIPE